MQRLLRTVALLLLTVLLLSAAIFPSYALDRDQRRQLIKSSVLILAMQIQNGKVVNIPWGGSGTIIDPKGLILTNYHVVQENGQWNALGILVTTRSDQRPEPAFLAEVVTSDPQLDLAVIRVSADSKGNPIDRTKLNLAAVPLGDADALELGDELEILGYPGIGSNTITFTQGKVAGFLQEQGISYQRAWIKTDATIAGGNSGGTAVDETGKLVGVPTRSSAVDVRQIADTNGDGIVDENDSAVPVGGFINLLRPINLAYPLINRARNAGVAPDPSEPARPTPSPKQPSTTAQGGKLGPFTFSSQKGTDDQPVNVATSFPSGIASLYAFSDYQAMTKGLACSRTWSIDGEVVLEKAFSWDLGQQGTVWFSLANGGDPLPPGEYTLKVSVAGAVVQSGSVTVGVKQNPNQKPVASSRGVTMSGYVLDAYTGEAVQGAYVIILKPGVTVRAFLAQQRQDQVASMGTTDIDGYYTVAPPLPRGYDYGVVIAARGYQTIAEDEALSIASDDADAVTMEDVQMVPA